MSPTAKIAQLPDRGVVSVSGPEAKAFLDNLITNDMDRLDAGGALFAGLLTPQGKILFEFFVVGAGEGYLLETQGDHATALAKRLTMYKLRAKVDIRDESHMWVSLRLWGVTPHDKDRLWRDTIKAIDPRSPELGGVALLLQMNWDTFRKRAGEITHTAWTFASAGDYHAHRVAHGIAEAPRDYALGDTFPHEANWDRYGVSFAKGCYVGQEVVSRMQNKSVVRKRVVKVTAPTPLTPGSDIAVGEAVIGKVGTVAGNTALAMLRLDRTAEADDKGQKLSSGGIVLTVAPVALTAYRDSVKNKPVVDL